MSSLKGDKAPCARLCHIVKWDDFDGYGFNLHAEKGKNGQFIGKVDDGSPSQAAGLRQGDRIVEVNEINIANETHKQVVERIKAFPNETKLLVVDQEADEYFRANNIVIKGTMANVKVNKTPEKNPNSVEQEELNGSNASIDENVQKSSGSNDTTTSHSESSTVSASATSATRIENESEREEVAARENGNANSDSTTSTTTGHMHATGNGNVAGNGSTGSDNGNGEPRQQQQQQQQGLNLKMSAKELRAQLAARKKYDPKKESIGFKDKFDIVQKL
ncbi:Na(+)/H(+) exchange regulatory cofactor NHE-RF2 [Habropoda laboriosa]|uniref:Na(+)/H(+) exchange regulatory cofactor NHE-RF2 n=1 Tax=Habropoda laboriosa TaxID=597456 RepID=A0A0L7QL21_9HYME|nr:PREDICTED: Na(+)/H(+) exchange regulatory cofactor NHE-RF1 [Habropoda laboriosa]KOC59322.1 Na(+)/H(+) exchange regulatory cofactor NHE-RF2 [Habropoda laboriosa]